jgi:hypothetical protein
MIIGNTSLDPRKIIYAFISKGFFKVQIIVMYSFGELITKVNVKCKGMDDASNTILKIDQYAHKDDLIDAISDKTLEEVEDSLSGCYAKKMGFK